MSKSDGDTKNAFVSSLFQAKEKPKSSGPLIQDMSIADADSIVEEVVSTPVKPVEDEKSMMELMMEAQKDAQKAKKIIQEKEKAKITKEMGGGFKKGFLGGGSSKKTVKAKPTTNKPSTVFNTDTISNTKSKSDEDIITLNKPKANSNVSKKNEGLVLDEVQNVMKEEEKNMVNQLKQGEWMNDNLVAKFQANPVIRNGLLNPKCVTAMKLLQTDPKAAQKKFQGDPEVELFMKEFGGVMSEHFNALGEEERKKKQEEEQKASKAKTAPRVEEIGVLQYEAEKRHQERQRAKKNTNSTVSNTVKETPVDEKQVEKVLQNDELRQMLLDPELQKILQECGDPVKFQKHMRDPVIAGKIKLLYDNGLVGTAK